MLFAQDKKGISDDHPLGIYFTSVGQIAGVRTSITGNTKEIGNAAPENLVQLGFWKALPSNQTWVVDVSFREPSAMCSGVKSDMTLGDRVVINQDTIAYSMPLTAKDAGEKKWDAGSCMTVPNRLQTKGYYIYFKSIKKSY